MVKVIRRFFDFCGAANRKKFVASIWLGVLLARFEALKIPAIAVMMRAMLPVELGGNGGITTRDILLSLGIMLLSILGSGLAKAKATMLQTEAGYDTCAMKRIEIAEHMRYLPIHAGWKTFFVWLWVRAFYAHRQRKWIRLLRREEQRL